MYACLTVLFPREEKGVYGPRKKKKMETSGIIRLRQAKAVEDNLLLSQLLDGLSPDQAFKKIDELMTKSLLTAKTGDASMFLELLWPSIIEMNPVCLREEESSHAEGRSYRFDLWTEDESYQADVERALCLYAKTLEKAILQAYMTPSFHQAFIVDAVRELMEVIYLINNEKEASRLFAFILTYFRDKDRAYAIDSRFLEFLQLSLKNIPVRTKHYNSEVLLSCMEATWNAMKAEAIADNCEKLRKIHLTLAIAACHNMSAVKLNHFFFGRPLK